MGRRIGEGHADDGQGEDFAVRSDVRDGEVYLDLGSPVFAKTAKSKAQTSLQSQ
jgi:hypothetical protein